jgi:hypothetical protein
MVPRTITGIPDGELPGPPVIKALCHFPEGHVAQLPVIELSLDGAFICSVRPPPVGTDLTVTLQAAARTPIPALEARVVSRRIDPAAADQSGFMVAFQQLADRQRQRLEDLVGLLRKRAPSAKPSPPPAVAERRKQPRVDVDFIAEVPLPIGVKRFRMQNLSMSGALLVIRGRRLPSGVFRGANIDVRVHAPDVEEVIPLQAEVVRVNDQEQPLRVAVRFHDMDDDTAALLESLILYALIQAGFPAFPYVGA